ELCFHNVGSEIHVLDDINSFVTFTEEMNKDFSKNQVIRVLDQYGNDIALLFNTKYLGKIQNDKDGRVSFWGDLDDYNKKQQKLRAVTNYNPEELTVEAGEEKDSVVVENPVQAVCAMAKCYMRVYVR
ncbi:MAG: phage tail sheath C-terminal domain-containing protein, partial [Acetivibrio ethanolgignens]